jgi:cytochrome c oxidase subunit 1
LTTTAEPTAAEAPDPRSAITPQPIVSRPFPEHAPAKGSMLGQLLRTTDHKLIGKMYLVTSFVFFMVGGVLALLMRAELARPGMQFLSPEQYNQLSPCTARSCCCSSRRRSCSPSPTWCCRCRSARPTSRSRA